MRTAIIFLLLLAAQLAFGEVTEIRRGDFTLTYTVCPQCPFRARFAPDGKRCFLNTSRVAERDRDAMSERLFALMKEATSLQTEGATNETNIFLNLMRQKERDVTGTTRYLTLRNDADEPRAERISFADLKLGGTVQIFEFGDPADLGAFTGTFETTVPPHGVRFFRLDAARRTDDPVTRSDRTKETALRCSLTVTPRPGTSSSTGSSWGSKTITRSLKWRVETRFRENRPEKLEVKAFYLGYNDKNKIIQLGSETKTLSIDKNGRSDVELTSPTTRMTRSRTTSTSSGGCCGRSCGGLRSLSLSRSVTHGERVAGCVLQLFADGKLVKSWTSDARWAIEAKKDPFSIESLNKNSGKIGLR